LALTQNKKNKDIPEFGSKGTILLEPSNQSDDAGRCVHLPISSPVAFSVACCPTYSRALLSVACAW
jgi:NAD-specific glutamate dehydrogenase